MSQKQKNLSRGGEILDFGTAFHPNKRNKGDGPGLPDRILGALVELVTFFGIFDFAVPEHRIPGPNTARRPGVVLEEGSGVRVEGDDVYRHDAHR